jgi:hypothetical protein
MKKIALISTFCDTEEKQNILLENIKILKNNGIDVMCLSPNFIQLPHNIVEKSDFVFYTKENPLLSWPEKSWTFWRTINTDKGWVRMTNFVNDYGWAALYQTKKLSEIALTFEYNIFYHMIYDTELSENLIKEIRSDEVNIIHPRRDPNNPETLWETTLHFMVFDREMMENIVKEITLKEYLSDEGGAAEGEVLKWKKKFNIPTKGTPVKDKIFLYKNKDLFNYSNDDNYKFFVNKNENYSNQKPELKIIFYDIKIDGNIQLIINDIVRDFKLIKDNNKIIELDVHCNDIEKFIITFNGDNYNFTETYLNISRNYINFE